MGFPISWSRRSQPRKSAVVFRACLHRQALEVVCFPGSSGRGFLGELGFYSEARAATARAARAASIPRSVCETSGALCSSTCGLLPSSSSPLPHL